MKGGIQLTNLELKTSVINELRKLPMYKQSSSGIQHVVRCPYCGDSRNLSHGHFSIKIDCNDPEIPMVYRCFKCGESGLLTDDVLEDLGLSVSIKDKQTLKMFNRKATKHNKLTDTKIEDNDLIDYSNNPGMVTSKLDYINGRLGTNFTASDIVKLRIVPNIIDFLALNKIKDVDMSYKQLKFYDINYVGFLVYNKNCVVLRDISGNARLRYDKLVLNKRNIDKHTFYSIPNGIDILYTHPINIHISEGIMDILSVYSNLNNCNLENNYYYAVCGFGYTTIIKNIIRMGINTGLNIHLYADNDKTDNDILSAFNRSNLLEWIDHLYIHRNACNGQKDYGVPMSNIRDSAKRIK